MRSRKDIWLLREKLIRADLKCLDFEMKRRPELEKLLTTKLKDLPEKYWNLVDAEALEDYLDQTLYQVIEKAVESDRSGGIFFSETENGYLAGFASYEIVSLQNVKKVHNVSIFSFDVNAPSITMTRDVINLLKELTSKYWSVRFYTNEDSFADKLYIKVLNREGYHYDRDVYEGIADYEVYNEDYYNKVVKNRKTRVY